MLKENLMVKALNKFDDICFLVIVDGEEYKIGEGEPTFTAKFKESIPVSKLLSSTSLALGEAYMSGNLEIEGDLYHALDYFMSEMDKFSIDKKAMKKLIFTSISKKNQEKEVRSHYDIGNDFYKLWLDETMSYSCGYFLNDNDTLYQAQVNKVDYILKKLYLKEGMTLLDIGCGWGFLLIEAAKKYKIHGTGITLSVEQYNEFRRRIVDEGLEDYLEVNFHTLDVENLRNHYNRTLLCWEKNYKEHIDEVREMFDEEFVRMWDLYLSACAAIFHNGIIDIHQILVSKGVNNDLPIVRWY